MDRVPSLSLQAPRRGREAFVDIAYEHVKALIFDGPLKPGQRINVELAMEQLHVSRQPLRDAINRLAHEGFVVVIPQVGYFVATVSPSEARDFSEVFSSFEGKMAAFAAQRSAEPERHELRRISDAVSRLWSRKQPAAPAAIAPRFRELDREFHGVIHRMAKAPKIEQVADALMQRYDFYIASTLGDMLYATRPDASHREHERVVSAILARDAQAAQNSMELHILHSIDRALATSRRRGDVAG